jgi:branched-subunit amino acid aminotransferase/4-amino-4-deoxychorismate lyase
MEPIAWINERLVPISQASLHVFDSGIAHGDAVAEMLRTFRFWPFRVQDHLERLFHSLDVARLASPYSRDRLASVINEVVMHNVASIGDDDDLGIIVFVTSGPNPTYVSREHDRSHEPTVGVHTFPLPFSLWVDKYEMGQHLVVPTSYAIPPDSLDPTAKYRSRIAWRIADREVRESNPGALAIQRDHEDNLTETSSGNLFAVIEGELRTPPANKVLNGVSRKVVLELAEKLEIPTRESDVTLMEAQQAEELWTSSTTYCLLPVTSLNGETIGNGTPGEIYKKVLAAWCELVGVDVGEQGMIQD